MSIDFTEYDYIENPYHNKVEVFGKIHTCYGIPLPHVDFFRAVGIYVKVDFFPATRTHEIDAIPVYWAPTNIPNTGVQHG